MRQIVLYWASVFVYTCGLQISGDYFEDNSESVYKYQSHNWDPSMPLPNTPINNLIVTKNGYVEDFKGTPLTATAVWKYEAHTPQYSFKNGSNGTVFDKGWMVDLVYDLSYILNFTVKGIQSVEYTFEYPNGTLTGPGGMILAGEADLMIGLQYVSKDQLQALRPLHPVGSYRISAFLLQPKVGGARNIYTLPFRTTAWLVIFVILTGIAVSTLICCATENKYLQEFYHLQDSVIWIGGIFLSQSFFDPGTLPTRIIFVSALSLTLVLSNSYSAFIISSLATEYNPITTLHDLEKFKYRVIADERNSYTCAAIYTSNKTKDQYCGQRFYKNEIDAVQKLYRQRRGKFAYVKSLDLIAFTAKQLSYTDDEICSVTGLVLPFQKPLTAMYGFRNSPLTSILNSKFLKIHERGVNFRYKQIFARQTNVICSERQFKYDPDIEISDVYIAFCVLLLGVIMSCFLCFFERWFLRISRGLEKINQLHAQNSKNTVELKSEEYENNYYYYHYN